MPAGVTAYEHLTFNADGEPFFAQTRFEAMHLIREHVAYGWSADELALNHPQLSLGQIYSALAWYADHRVEVDGKLEAEMERTNAAYSRPENRRLAILLKRRQLG
jgi:uncharacterized protein (DUF433 family)